MMSTTIIGCFGVAIKDQNIYRNFDLPGGHDAEFETLCRDIEQRFRSDRKALSAHLWASIMAKLNDPDIGTFARVFSRYAADDHRFFVIEGGEGDIENSVWFNVHCGEGEPTIERGREEVDQRLEAIRMA